MFGLGYQELLVIGVIALVLGGITLGRRGGGVRILGPALVLRRFRVSESPSDGVHIDVVGRVSGILAWVFTTIGVQAETSLTVTATEVAFRRSSLFGQVHHVVVLPHVSSTHCGYSKPIGLLIVGGLIAVWSVLAAFTGGGNTNSTWAGLILGGVLLLAYWLLKKMTISVQTSGGTPLGLNFKRSVIEGVRVDIQRVRQAIELVNKKVMESHVQDKFAAAVSDRKASVTGGGSREPLNTTASGGTFCVMCGARVAPGQRFCPACGANQT